MSDHKHLAALMQFAHRPQLNWRPRSYRARNAWCGLCGARNPLLFDLPDPVWLFYVGQEQRHQVVCLACWHWLTEIIDGARFQSRYGGPLPLCSYPRGETVSAAVCRRRWERR